VREAVLVSESGVPRAGDVEVHIRASDFRRHGHEGDPAYDGVILHLVWTDDRPAGERGHGVPLASGASAPTVAVAEAFAHDAARIERLVARGPDADGRSEPCAAAVPDRGDAAVIARVRREGERRLAERAWRTARLIERGGLEPAWALLLDRAVYATAGRRRENPAEHAARLAAIDARLGPEPLVALRAAAEWGRARELAALLQGDGVGQARALEIAWNAALPLLIAVAAAYGDFPLARQTAALARSWPSPRPYGRTRALAAQLGVQPSALRPAGGGALYAQGLLHLQDLWCSRGGCGVCPLSAPYVDAEPEPGEATTAP
jgi:hypothetical protein